MTENKIGKLKKADLRSIWPNEERDFSAWLADPENLSLLGNEIGIDISLIEREAGVGKFSVDILAEEEGTGKKIIIENQLENTNHDHLGKIITYAAGHDAPIVIWVFKDIREEHRQAIDWLNDNTNEGISFFAVKLEAWQIDTSVPAPKFQIISKPNEWAKTIRKTVGTVELGATKLKQLSFWTNLKSYASEKGVVMFRQTPSPQHWYNIAIGSSDANISLTVNTRENMLGSEIYINSNKDLFKYLQDRKEDIEKEVGSPLEWIDAKKASRILQRKPNFDLDNEAEAEAAFEWLIGRATIFHKVFSTLVKEFKNGN